MDGQIKNCCRCGLNKPFDEFPWRVKKRGMRHYFCKECSRRESAKVRSECPELIKNRKARYHAKNRGKLNSARAVRKAVEIAKKRAIDPSLRPLVDFKLCRRCNAEKCASEFYMAAGSPDHLAYWCMDCTRNNVATWVKKNKVRASAQRHLRRALVCNADGFHTDVDLKRIELAQNGKCAACKSSLSQHAEIDHIIPLSKGGSNWPQNIQWLCRSCNRSKHDRDPIEFMRSRGRLL